MIDIWQVLIAWRQAIVLINAVYFLTICPFETDFSDIKDAKIFILWNAFKNVICKTAAMLFRLQYVNSFWPGDTIWRHCLTGDTIWRQTSRPTFVQVLVYCLFGMEPTFCQLDIIKIKTFHWRKCISKCHLQTGGHFLQVPLSSQCW